MVKVCIQKKLLAVADMLLEIFTMRMADAILHGDTNAQSRVGDAAGVATSKISPSHDVFDDWEEEFGATPKRKRSPPPPGRLSSRQRRAR